MVDALERMLAMRAYKRGETVHGQKDLAVLKQTGMDEAMVEDMYQIMAIANYEDRFVIPTSHKEMVEDSFKEKGSCGFTFGNGCSGGDSPGTLFGKEQQGSEIFVDMPKSRKARVETL